MIDKSVGSFVHDYAVHCRRCECVAKGGRVAYCP